MDFTKTQTFYNLARGFAGECQAGMRYQLTAKAATAEGYQVLSDTIRSIAKNETVHATIFFNEIIKNAGSQENVHIDANYPFHAGSLAENLKFARRKIFIRSSPALHGTRGLSKSRANSSR